MNYELAKQLKGAGFSQNPQGQGYFINVTGNPFVFQSFNENEVYVPTLSELIHACGEDFIKLVQTNKLDEKEKEMSKEVFGREIGHWMAYSYRYYTDGSTPEEAIAKLWLLLNNK